jgi:hypothetical protein
MHSERVKIVFIYLINVFIYFINNNPTTVQAWSKKPMDTLTRFFIQYLVISYNKVLTSVEVKNDRDTGHSGK